MLPVVLLAVGRSPFTSTTTSQYQLSLLQHSTSPNMPFVLSEFREEDCTEFAILDEAASQGWPLARAMEQGMESRQEMFEQWFHGKFGKQTDLKWVKVVDDASGEMAAGALWQFATQPTKPTPSTQSTVVGKGKHGEFEVAGVPPVFEAMGRGWQEFRDEYIPDQPYASMLSSR